MSKKEKSEGLTERLKKRGKMKQGEIAEESSATTEEKETMSDETRFEIIEDGLRKKYLTRLNELEVVRMEGFEDADEDLAKNVCLYHIAEISYREGDMIIDKLINVYNTLCARKNSTFLIIESDGEKVDFYLGIRNNDEESDMTPYVPVMGETFKNTLKAYFPSIQIEDCSQGQVRELSDKILNKNNISSVSVNGNYRSKDPSKNFVQGLENLICAMQGKKYMGIIIAENVPMDIVETGRKDLQELYSKLSPYRNTHYSENPPAGGSGGKSFSKMSAKEKALTIGNFVVNVAGLALGIAIMGPMGSLVGSMITGQITGLMNTLAPDDGADMASRTSTSKDSMYENRKVSDLLRVLDEAIKRTEEYEMYGMWDVAAYFTSDEPFTSEMAAVNYKALMMGEGYGYQVQAINTWKSEDEKEGMDEIRKCLSRFVHPRFIYCSNDDNKYAVYTNAAMGVSGKKLPLYIGL